MRGRPGVWARTRRLAANRPAGIDEAAARVAADLGCRPDEVIAGAAALAERCRAAGATTLEAQTAFLAAELGIEPQELAAEARRLARGGA